MINGIDAGRFVCECGQALCELDVRIGADGELIGCPNCGNCTLIEEREPFAAIFARYRRAQLRHFQFLREQDIAPGAPGKFKCE